MVHGDALSSITSVVSAEHSLPSFARSVASDQSAASKNNHLNRHAQIDHRQSKPLFSSPCADKPSFASSFNIAHVNINSITAPYWLDELEQFAESNHIHVLCTTETKLDTTVNKSLYTMSSFSQPLTRHRNRKGGGVAIYARNYISCTRICELELEDVEWVWVKIRVKCHAILICCVYFPPNKGSDDFRNFLDKLSDSVIRAQQYVPSLLIILGDFNVGNVYLRPEFTNHSGITSLDVLFKDTVHCLDMKQLISEPTRISGTVANLRDLILVSDTQNIIRHDLLSPFSQIDHIPIYASLKYPVKSNKTYIKTMWDYRKMNIDEFIHMFEQKDWNEINDMEIDEAVKFLTKLILDAASRCIPKRNIYVHEKDKPWVNAALKSKIKQRNKLFAIAKNSKVIAMNRRLKRKYLNNQIKKLVESKQNPRKYHQIIRKMIGRNYSSSFPPLITTNGEIIENNEDKTNLLNDYFASQSKCLSPELEVPLCVLNDDIPTLEEIAITEDEVFIELKNLNVNKACGSDGIPNKILKMIAIFLKEPLTKILNKSLAERKYPTDWKHANVIPVFKNKGTMSDVKHTGQ